MEGERGVVVEKGRQGQSKEAFSGEWKLTGDSEVIIEKGGQCRSLKTSSGGRTSGGEIPVARRSVSQCAVSFRNGTWSPVRGSGSTTYMSMRFSLLTVGFLLSESNLLVTTTVSSSIWTDLSGPGLCSQQECHRPQQQTSRCSVEEIEDKVPCRDTYPFDGNWVRENTGSRVEGTLI
jgi:hypothetical protein